MLKIRSNNIISFAIVFCMIAMTFQQGIAADLDTNLLVNPGGESVANNGVLTSNGWSGDARAYSNKNVDDFATVIGIENQYNHNDMTSVLSVVPKSGDYYIGFATTGSASVGAGTYSCYQDIDISANQTDVDGNSVVFNVSGWLSATGGNVATLSLEQLDSSSNVISTPLYEESITASSWTNVTISGAVAPSTRYLRIKITGTHSACGLAAFDDLSLKISSNSSAPPVISQILNQTMISGKTLGPLSFSVSDADTPSNEIILTAVSSNTSLIPNSNISTSLSEGNGTINLTAVNGQTGSSMITITVSDGTKSTNTSFNVAVNTDILMDTNLISLGYENWTDPSSRFYFNSAKNLYTHSYSDSYYMYKEINVNKFASLIDAGFLTYTGSCTTNQNGNMNILFKNSSGGIIETHPVGSNISIPSSTRTIRIELGGSSGCEIGIDVNFVINSSQLPKITPIPDKTIRSENSTGEIPFVLGYKENSATLSVTSSNTSLVPTSQITFGGSGYDRNISLTSIDGISGSSTIKIFVNAIELDSFVFNKVIQVTSLVVSGAGNVNTVANGESLQMNALIAPDNATNKNITWSVTNGTGSAEISDAGLLTGTGVGEVTVKASANDGSQISSTKLITISGITMEIKNQPQSIDAIYGYTDSQALDITVQTVPIDSGKTISYQWYKDGVIINDAIAKTYLIPTGLAVGNYNYYCKVVCNGYTVNSDVATVSVSKLSGNLTNKDYPTIFTYNASKITVPTIGNFNFNSDGIFTYSWYKGDSIDEINKLNEEPADAGTYKLKIDISETTNASALSITISVNIVKESQSDLFINEVVGKKFGDSDFNLLTTGGSGTGEVTYSAPQDNGVLSINGNTASILGVGKVTITATKVGDANYNNDKTATLEITIEKGTNPIIVYPLASEISYGQLLSQSELTGGSQNLGSFAWTDGDLVPNAGTSNYSVTFIPNQNTINNFETISNTTSDVNLQVNKNAPSISLQVGVTGQADNRKATLTATVISSDNLAIPSGIVEFVDTTSGSAFNITLANEIVENGIATYIWEGLKEEIYKVKAIYNGDSNYETVISSELSFDTSKTNQADFVIANIEAKTYGYPSFTLTTTGGNGTGEVSYKSSDESILRITGNVATIKKIGSVTITAVKADDDDYNEIQTTTTVTINKKDIKVKATDKLNIIKGSNIPDLTYTVEDFVNGDSFTTPPMLSTLASNTNTLGEFIITISGGSIENAQNYNISYINGKLTIINNNDNNNNSGSNNGNSGNSNTDSSGNKESADNKNPQPVNPSQDIKLPATLIENLLTNQATDYKITSNNVELKLDLETLKTIKQQLGSDAVISAKKVDTNTLSQDAKAIIGNRPVYEFNITGANGQKLTNFGSGNITISIPYILEPGEKPENIVAYYIDANGNIEQMPNAIYDEQTKTLIFVTNHFSKFAVGYDENKITNSAETKIETGKTDLAEIFTDIPSHWAKADIEFVTSRGLFGGTGDGKFSPNMSMTRGMFVTVLGKLANVDVNKYNESNFVDVKLEKYYAPYINWANEMGIVSGISTTSFAPDIEITREQMAAILSGYSKAMNIELAKKYEENIFADNSYISPWAKEQVKLIQMAGIVSGKENNKFDPKGTATRAEVSSMLRRFIEMSQRGIY